MSILRMARWRCFMRRIMLRTVKIGTSMTVPSCGSLGCAITV
ncbi:unnamed protein product [Chondrus crispus]|uniref:Uncharacterized protein n=1 Tax=Chondrus crispus TaxID=2769 RepID=R7QAP1_CHOCR|nr:unnamed protein product [Chondrus crispus]CDF34868.1 unnamed protein product [Chondrus crispus]|eukprot:XP_005714687.1 unnamed protein product [Chondrus crispus]